MIVKPQHFAKFPARAEPSAHDVVAHRIADVAVVGASAIGLLRGALFGVLALPSLYAGLAAGITGNLQVFVMAGGFGLLMIWRAKRAITTALAGRGAERS